MHKYFAIALLSVCTAAAGQQLSPLHRSADDYPSLMRESQLGTAASEVRMPGRRLVARRPPAAPSATVNTFRKESLNCLTADAIAAMKADRTTALTYFRQCRSELQAKLGSNFTTITDGELFYLFLNEAMYSMYYYGEAGYGCDDYTFGLIATAVANGYRQQPTLRPYMIGWYGGAVGDHAQIFLVYSASGLPRDWTRAYFLDPTFATVVKADLNQIAAGKPIDPSMFVDFSWRTELQDEHQRIMDAMANGEFLPYDLFYFMNGNIVEQLMTRALDPTKFQNRDYWFSPGASTFASYWK